MSADSFHGLVEKGIKKKNNLWDYQDLVEVVNEKGNAMLMKFDDFLKLIKHIECTICH